MNYVIGVRKSQVTYVTIIADSLDEALDKASFMCDDYQIDDAEFEPEDNDIFLYDKYGKDGL